MGNALATEKVLLPLAPPPSFAGTSFGCHQPPHDVPNNVPLLHPFSPTSNFDRTQTHPKLKSACNSGLNNSLGSGAWVAWSFGRISQRIESCFCPWRQRRPFQCLLGRRDFSNVHQRFSSADPLREFIVRSSIPAAAKNCSLLVHSKPWEYVVIFFVDNGAKCNAIETLRWTGHEANPCCNSNSENIKLRGSVKNTNVNHSLEAWRRLTTTTRDDNENECSNRNFPKQSQRRQEAVNRRKCRTTAT